MTPLLLVEPEADYRAKAAQYLTSHALADFRLCPAIYKGLADGTIPAKDVKAFRPGTGIHCLVLEPDKFAAEYTVADGPINPTTGNPFGRETKKYAAWLEQQTGEVVSTAEFTEWSRLADSVRAHPLAQAILADGQMEGVARAEEFQGMPIPVQARIDCLSPLGVADVKTCQDIDWFEKNVSDFGYVFQMAFYHDVLFEVLGRDFPVHLIAVEKQPPYRCGVFRIPPGLLTAAADMNVSAIRRLIDCRERDCWPTGYEELRIIERL